MTKMIKDEVIAEAPESVVEVEAWVDALEVDAWVVYEVLHSHSPIELQLSVLQ